MENVFLIVGLGNPGTEYAQTRHNAGFMTVQKLAEQWRATWGDEKKFQARIARADLLGRRVLLCQPQTFMNLSGAAVGKLSTFYRLVPEQIAVVVDDADLPLGEIRLRPSGGSGGHHGLESIAASLGSQNFPRLRVGIGRRDETRQIVGHVLGKFDAAEYDLLEKVLARASNQIECWLREGLPKAMSLFNGKIEA